jgi:hypothetical protein
MLGVRFRVTLVTCRSSLGCGNLLPWKRPSEIGIRMALGTPRGDILRGVKALLAHGADVNAKNAAGRLHERDAAADFRNE